MELNSHENRQFRSAKLESIEEQTSASYQYNEFGDIIIDEFGEPILKEETIKHKIFTPFRYNMVGQAQLQKIQYIANVWNQDALFTIKTYDPIDPKTTDRVIMNDKAYTIDNIYKEFNDSTAGMFKSGGYCTTYISLKGVVTI